MLRILFNAIAVIGLTLLTQLGGLAWLVATPVRRTLPRVALFCAAYASLWATAQVAAPVFGRVPIPCLDRGPEQIAVLTPLYCALNRNYVDPALLSHSDALAQHMHATHPGTRVRALDGSFPFLDGFPLLPHLSHDNGAQLDLAFFYTDASDQYLPGKARSPIGYWAFENPAPGTSEPCKAQLGPSLRWDMGWLQPLFPDRPLELMRTAEMLRWLAANPASNDDKVLIEPHLAQTLGVAGERIRFQGCRAARHDDHIHLQIRL